MDIRDSDLLTVAAVRARKGGPAEYRFHERARVFRLAAEGADGATRLLDAARRRRLPVRAELDLDRGQIARVTVATDDEIARFARAFPRLEKPSKIAKIDVARLDPTTFNIVGHHLKWPAFRLCQRVIPSYAKAKEIFDFCASLSCHLPGPPAIAPCIPFQYVIDGCYARAHQMRRIITTKYRYCCEKVFSFATAGNDTLAVKADKWGGCCVRWWYHVAPLVRVRIKVRPYPPYIKKALSFDLAMVIDPGMFDKPVLLSTWLAAQENTACSPHAHVTSYSIQPGSAYTPGFGGAFSTDPAYTATEGTLIGYRNGVTCP